MYYIEVSAKADKFLEKLDKHTKQILEKKLKKLKTTLIRKTQNFWAGMRKTKKCTGID